MLRRSACQLLGIALLACACGHSRAPSAQHPMLGQAVSISLPSDGGQLVTIPANDAHATVLDFWGPTCVPCRTKLPALMARKSDIEARGGRLVLVAVLADDESTQQAQESLRSWGVDSPFLVDREGASRSQLGITGLPAVLVTDAKGVLVWSAPPEASTEDVLGALP